MRMSARVTAVTLVYRRGEPLRFRTRAGHYLGRKNVIFSMRYIAVVTAVSPPAEMQPIVSGNSGVADGGL